MLLQSQPFSVLSYLYSKPEHIENMAKHMYSNSMMTAVSMSINCKRDVFTPSVPSGGKPVGIQT